MTNRLLILAFLISFVSISVVRASETKQAATEIRPLYDILEQWAAEGTRSDSAAAALYQRLKASFDFTFRMPLARDASNLKKLAKPAPESYVALFGLYRRAHTIAVMRRDIYVANRLMSETTRLIDEYIRYSNETDRQAIGARVLFSLGLNLVRWGDMTPALDGLAAAHDLDPNNPHALHLAAAIYEKQGLYSSAKPRLRKVVALTGGEEARLRLALCRARSGQTRRAQQDLSALAEGAIEGWIQSVAYQEWAQLTLEKGNPEGAEAIARAGLEQLPDDESLAVLVAFLSGPRDLGGRLIVNRLTSTPQSAEESARGRYNMWPWDRLESETALEAEIGAALPALTSALRARQEP